MVAHEVLPGLFVGDAAAAQYPAVAQFDFIVNVTREVRICNKLRADQRAVRFDTLQVNMSDQASMVQVMRRAYAVISEAMDRGQVVLCHCLEGRQRSCTVVAFCVMTRMRLPPVEACAYVRSKHPPAWEWGNYVHFMEALNCVHSPTS